MHRGRPLCHRLFATLAIVLAFTAAACDDDGGDEPTAVPSATLAPTEAASTPAATRVTTIDPDVTPGPPIAIELTADPQQLTCDGEQGATVTALVVDALNHPVADGTDVSFEVVALGTADPINTTTSDGIASSTVVALGSQIGVVVNASSGEAAGSIRIDCQ